ncbi:MAG: CLC_0170 family protein [Ignavibacteriales bacterium]
MFARQITGSLQYVSIAFLLAGLYLLGVSARGLSQAGDDAAASIAVGVGWVYVAVGVLAAIGWVVMG